MAHSSGQSGPARNGSASTMPGMLVCSHGLAERTTDGVVAVDDTVSVGQ